MMRLIDADKLHYIKVMILHPTEEDRANKDVVVFAKEIDKAPTIDADFYCADGERKDGDCAAGDLHAEAAERA